MLDYTEDRYETAQKLAELTKNAVLSHSSDLAFRDFYECECCGDFVILFDYDGGTYYHEIRITQEDNGYWLFSGYLACRGSTAAGYFEDACPGVFLNNICDMLDRAHERFLK